MDLQLQPGDLFLVKSPSIVSKLINVVESWWAPDGKSKYTHSGIVVNEGGTIFESQLQKAEYSNISKYDGYQLLIARHDFMMPKVFEKAFERLQYHSGMMYPVHRLFLHIIPPLARIFAKDRAVCSELVGQLLYQAELLHYWKGITPDDLESIFIYWRYYNVIYERDE